MGGFNFEEPKPYALGGGFGGDNVFKFACLQMLREILELIIISIMRRQFGGIFCALFGKDRQDGRFGKIKFDGRSLQNKKSALILRTPLSNTHHCVCPHIGLICYYKLNNLYAGNLV